MKTWLVKDARARFGDVLAGALAGEPQRIARRGRDAVVVVSEADWMQAQPEVGRARSRKTMAQLVSEFPLTADEWADVRPPRLGLRSRPRAPLDGDVQTENGDVRAREA